VLQQQQEAVVAEAVVVAAVADAVGLAQEALAELAAYLFKVE
jgi:hypothetical protein